MAADSLILAIGSLIAGLGTLIASLGAWRKSRTAAAELAPNHGSSLKDIVTRIELKLEHVSEMQGALSQTQRSQGHQIGEIRRDALQTHELLADGLKEANRRISKLEP